MENNDVLVTIPFSRLMALLEPQGTIDELRHDLDQQQHRCEQMKREIEGLHRLSSELMQIVAELRRNLST